MDRMKIIDILDKCKDKLYINSNKSYLKDILNKPNNLEVLRSELNSRRNYFTLQILEKMQFDFIKILPNFELKKNITHYTYGSVNWLYKNKYLSEEKFLEIKEKFTVMKNYEKMFDDTYQNYITTRIDQDRKLFKYNKEESNKIKDRNEEIKKLIEETSSFKINDFKKNHKFINGITEVDIFTVILNVDEFFDLSTLNYVEAEEGKGCISEIKKIYSTYIGQDLFGLSKLQCIDPDSDLSYEDIPEEKELCDIYAKVDKNRNIFNRKTNITLKFSNLDRILNHRISKLHGLINQLQKNSIEVYIVSCVSLTQLLAEITFFEFNSMEMCNIFSLRNNKEEMYNKIMGMISGRIALFGESKILKRPNTFQLDFKYLKSLVYNLEQNKK
ncbi:hypothetical protein NBO_41g0007 [Nosema bombycis CQ1]|uniref:Uncharacterized protein n=1 Tax=Nosema bombycis (strain CQ1 / CVCC 102059) TaxID=578461 RepID=R0KT98_NOSB1|nr:hypothetical protein NBO_41g0007 [Nosema bombycis CQ1]|eukprot:EOB14031.1 hypothetical protein NBO_41g0007 [Nosema bombycis CQ1]